MNRVTVRLQASFAVPQEPPPGTNAAADGETDTLTGSAGSSNQAKNSAISGR